MLATNSHTVQARKKKLLEDCQIIQRTLTTKVKYPSSDHHKAKNEVTEVLKKFLQYRRNCTSSHEDTEAQIKVFAFNLYCSKPKIYKQLKSRLGLPDENDFQNFSIDFSPKFENSLLYFVSSKLNTLRPELNHFVLCLEKIKLGRNFAYDVKRDCILGFHNLSGAILNQAASDAYVMLLRNVRTNWVQLVSYVFVSEHTSHVQQLTTWCYKVIFQLLKVGVQVYAVVTSPNHIASESHPVPSYPKSCYRYLIFENNKNVYELYDLRYMIKAVRDCMITNDLNINGSSIISWHYIKLLFYQRELIKSSLNFEITAAHIHPRIGPDSRLRDAIEIFNINVYHGLNQLINRGILPSEARATADFVQVMSGLCDIVRYSPKSNKKIYINELIEVIESTLEMFQKISNAETAIVDMNVALSSYTQLLQNLESDGFRHVYMSRLNKAPLVAFFRSIPRVEKEGRRLRPTAARLRAAFARRFVAELRRPVRRPRPERLAAAARCGLLDPQRAPPAPAPRPPPLQLPFPNADYHIQVPLAAAANVYIAAFLLYKCMEVHTCPELYCYLSPRRLLFDSRSKHTSNFKKLNRQSAFYGKLLDPPKDLWLYVAKLLEESSFQMRPTVAGCKGERVVRGLGDVGPAPALCRCFPRQLLLRLLARLLLWLAVRYSNARLRSGQRRWTLFSVPRLRNLKMEEECGLGEPVGPAVNRLGSLKTCY